MVGALDALSNDAIAALAAEATSYPLLVRLTDGRTAEVGLHALHPLVTMRARELVAQGAYAVVVACAGDFPAVDAPAPVLLPGRIVPAVVRSLVRGPRIGVITPICAQQSAAEAKWRRDGFDPVVTWASPVMHDELIAAADLMHAEAPELVVLDCMGHDEQVTAECAARSGCAVVSAQAITARVAGALVPPSRVVPFKGSESLNELSVQGVRVLEERSRTPTP